MVLPTQLMDAFWPDPAYGCARLSNISFVAGLVCSHVLQGMFVWRCLLTLLSHSLVFAHTVLHVSANEPSCRGDCSLVLGMLQGGCNFVLHLGGCFLGLAVFAHTAHLFFFCVRSHYSTPLADVPSCRGVCSAGQG